MHCIFQNAEELGIDDIAHEHESLVVQSHRQAIGHF